MMRKLEEDSIHKLKHFLSPRRDINIHKTPVIPLAQSQSMSILRNRNLLRYFQQDEFNQGILYK